MRGAPAGLLAFLVWRRMRRTMIWAPRLRVPLALLLLPLFSPHTAAAHTGIGIAVDSARHCVYFSDPSRNRIWKIEADGRLSVFANEKHGSSLFLDRSGNLYLDHFSTHLLRITPQGDTSEIISTQARLRQAGEWAVFLGTDGEGNLYFAAGTELQKGGREILRLSPRGVETLAGGTRGYADGFGRNAQFTGVMAAAWAPDGMLYLADGNAIRKLAPDGRVTTLAGSPAEGDADGPRAAARFRDPRRMCFGEDGALYVADMGNRRVRHVAMDGHVSTLSTSGLMWEAAGVECAGGSVYVLENGRVPVPGWTGPRVRRVMPDGQTMVLVTLRGWTRGSTILAGMTGAALAGCGMLALGARWLLRCRYSRELREGL
jgi:sugar lactone lactonase YvrE